MLLINRALTPANETSSSLGAARSPSNPAPSSHPSSTLMERMSARISATFEYCRSFTSRSQPSPSSAVDDEFSDIDLTCGNRFSLTETTPIGSGSYGVVFAAVDSDDSEVAIKVVPKDRKQTFQPPEKEVKILKYVTTMNKAHKVGISRLVHTFESKSKLAMVTPRHREDLASYMSRRSDPVSIHFLQALAKQTLDALEFCEEHNIIHGDLKPSNLMITKDKKIELIDMGLSHTTFTKKGKVQHSQFPIQALRYRSLKAALNIPNYSTEIDLWSLGCILFEGIAGKPLINSNSNLNHGRNIIELMGPISEKAYQACPETVKERLVKTSPSSRRYVFKEQFDKDHPLTKKAIKDLIPRYCKPRVKKEKELFNQMIALIEKLLSYDPPSAKELLSHRALRDSPSTLPI